ncbi:bactofilin family protein [Ramlibacter algicola]|uniref:Polymer-forming cytoskeletal protein n=1 Tax=Ramlibacter algicola TaxID=2795217 RepID=A0A934Q185_9BURK|nr:polymer-forming cytoskeletal protein [Ramlibacter algicola]MBK0392762.1 polymer-forming cytoskeletal protein [Ramlibacter algicola]
MPTHSLHALRAFACALLLAAVPMLAAAKGEVNDLFAAGANVSVDRPVTGDAMLAGGTVEVRAPVSDRVRVAGGDVMVDSTIGGKVLAAGGNVTIGPEAVIGGDARVYAGDAQVDGRIEGNLHVSAGKVSINGQVRGDVVVRAGSVELGRDARIGGLLRYTGAELRRDEGAVVGGAVIHDAEARESRKYTIQGPGRASGVFFFVLELVVGALLLRFAPNFSARAADRTADSPASMVGLGFVVLVMLPVVFILLCILIIGIPFALALGAAVPVILLLSFALAVLGLAHRLPAMFRQAEPLHVSGQLAWFAIALAAVLVVGTVPVLGWLVMALFLLAGLGAFTLEIRRRRTGGPSSGGAPAGRPIAA